ncbi:MAG: tetratricopeptide repeat protein, partial [Pyrinomonadaceae bacterium]
LYRRVLALDSNSISAKIQLARIVYEQGRRDEAAQILSDIPANSNIEPATRLNLAFALFQVHEFQKSLAAIEKLPVKTKNTDALPVAAANYLELGNKQKLNELVPLMKKASAANPSLASQCAEVLQNAGMKEESVALLQAALSNAPNDVGVLVFLARLEVKTKDFDEAKRHLDRAAKLQPKSAEVLFAESSLANALGNSSKAFDLLIQARQIAPKTPAILTDFVFTAMRVNQTQAAVDAAQTLLEINAEEPEYQYLFGVASLQNGNVAAAQKSLENYVRQRPNDSRGCVVLGLTLAAKPEQLVDARRQFNHCIEINPNDFEAKYQLGLSYKTQGDTAKAIQYLEETVKLAPDYALALRDLGTLYLQANEDAKARTVLEKAVSLDSKDANTHFQLSRLYNLIGEPALAKQHLEMFQKLKNPERNPM